MLKTSPHNNIASRSSGYPRECDFCFPSVEFYDASEFARHLRSVHSSKEGGSYICRYGENNVCQMLPPEGVSDVDYESHIRKVHCQGTVPISSPATTSLEELPRFSVNSFTQNLSSVLQDPDRKKNDITTFFTRHWGDNFVQPAAVPSSHFIPSVTANNFAFYLKHTGKAHKKYKAAKKALSRLQSESATAKGDADDLPPVFVDSTFHLANGPTFNEIFTVPIEGKKDPLCAESLYGGAHSNAPKIAAEDLPASSFRNYEQLNSYLESLHDVVDNRLASKLVAKSDSFWQIVHSYGGLNEDLASAMHDVKAVRNSLKAVSELVCTRSKKIMELYEKRERKLKLLERLHDISCLRDAQSTVQMLLNQSDYPKAIDCIETSQEVLESELGGVHCFRHLGMQLHGLYGAIGKMMLEEFAQLVQKEFGARLDGSSFIHSEGELSAVLVGLMQVKKYSFMHVIRSEINESVKTIFRQVLKQRIVESGLDLTQYDPSLTNLAEPIRSMKAEEWLDTVRAVSDTLFNFCLRLQVFQDLLIELAEHVSATDSTSETSAFVKETSPQTIGRNTASSDSGSDNELDTSGSSFAHHISHNSDPSALISVEIRSHFHLTRAITVIAEYGHFCAQQRMCRLLAARSKEPVKNDVSATEVVEVHNIVNHYLGQCSEKGWHKILPASSSPLTACLQKVSVDFLNRFHNQRRTKIGEALDVELWRAAEIPAVFQALANKCRVEGRLRNIKNGSSEMSTSLDLNGESYVIVGSSITFVQILAEYCECLDALPSFVTDILSRIIELLKAFNSRCCQLILGAGALQLVGLKTISVKNLALASRSLQMIVSFIPFVSSEIEPMLKTDQKHLMRHFKQVLSDYTDHINEITHKLVNVIDHHTSSCLNSWELKGSMPSPAFQQICRQMQKFHNGLAGIIPNDQIKSLFETVHKGFKIHLKQQLAKMGITPHDSLTYGLVCQDYTFYVQSLHNLECCSQIQLETLNEVVYGR